MKKLYLLDGILKSKCFEPIIRNHSCVKCFAVTNDNDLNQKLDNKIDVNFCHDNCSFRKERHDSLRDWGYLINKDGEIKLDEQSEVR